MSVSFTLDRKQYEVTPGSSFSMKMTVTNNGTQVERFRISIRGLPGSTVTVEPPTLNLEGGQHGDAHVRVIVPPEAPIRAGRQIAAVQVAGTTDPLRRKLREFDVKVSPNPRFQLAAQKGGRRSGRYQRATLAIENTGNVPLRLSVRGQDPKNLVRVDLPAEPVEVQPFDSVHIDALLRGPIQGFGQKATHTVEFEASGMRLEQQASYTMDQRPALGKSLKPYAAVALLLIAGFLLWPRYLIVADYTGTQVDEAVEALATEGIEPTVQQRHDPLPAGTVLASRPAAGTELRVGGPIPLFAEELVLVESLGPETREIPNVIGMTRAAAEAELGPLQAIGVEIAFASVPDDDAPVREVVRTEPVSGELASGDTLTVYVSEGPAEVEVPSLIGKNIGEVRQTAEELGLVVAEPERRSVDDETQADLVVDQIPTPGSTTTAGKTLTVWIGEYEPPPEETTQPEEG